MSRFTPWDRKVVWTLWGVFASFLSGGSVSAETPREKGRRIAEEADEHHAGFEDFQVDGTMILEDSGGRKSKRFMEVKLKEGKKDGDKSLMTFEKPADIEGTALLTHVHKEGEDDQWLYLPAMKRIKRIASSNKTGPFMGSEFSYEDMTPREVEDYKYRYLKTVSCGRRKCHRIVAIPVDENSAYKKQIVNMDVKEYRMLKTEYFDKKGKHIKTLISRGYKKHEGEHWAASRQVMTNHVTGKRTIVLWENYDYGEGLTDRDFDLNTLKRTR